MDVIEVQRISVADNHACWLIENGGSGCWGNRLAPSNVSLNARPAGLIDGGAPLPLRSIVAGSSNSGAAKLSFACGLTTSGLAACWGDGFQAQFVPPNGTLFHDIAADDWTACGVAHDGRVHCWGGHAGLVDDAPPGLYKSISVGSGHACALTQMGTVRCWGNGGHPREDLPACEPDDENCEPHAAEVRTGRNETPTPPT